MQNSIFKEIEIEGQSKASGRLFPKCLGPIGYQNFVHFQQYLSEHAQELITDLNKEGALFFRGFDIQSPEQFSSILSQLGLKSFEYVGGAAVRKLIVGSETRKSKSIEVFTTNEAPPAEPIPFHNQLLQNQNYPDYISFYCHSEADKGGSTPLVSCTELYQYIEKTHPDFLKKLTELGVRYIRVVSKQDNPKSPIGRGWANIFKVNNREEANEKIPQNGYQCEWLDTPQEDCRLISKKLDAITTSKSGAKVFCNQMIAVFKGWIDDKNSPDKCLKFGDMSEIPSEILEDISAFADKAKAVIDWRVGDFVIIDNQMAKHAREPFQGGNRKIYASLMKGEQPVKNKIYHTLHSGDQLPAIGLGTWKLPKQVAEDIVYEAIKAGYRTIDAAACYGNQVEVGRGINKAIADKIVSREELWVTSKLWNTFHRKEHVRPALQRTLKDLNLDYLDLYLIHWPVPVKYVDFETKYPTGFEYHPISENGPTVIEDNVPHSETWQALEALHDEGLIRNIGVSNFPISLLRDLLYSSRVKPAVNQIQLHPELAQKKMIRFCRSKGVHITSYSTMGGTGYVEMNLATSDKLVKDTQGICNIAKKYNKTSPQVLFRWAVQQGLSVIPKTSKVERLPENLTAETWNMEEEDMKAIDSFNKDKRFCDSASICKQFFNIEVPCFD